MNDHTLNDHTLLARPSTPAGPPATGRLSYGLGFLGYLPIPVLSGIIAGAAMAGVYPRERRKGPLAAENARQAANWGITLAVVLVLALLGVLSMLATGADDRAGLLMLPVIAVGIIHLVVILWGLSRASRGLILDNALAVPFLRAPETHPQVEQARAVTRDGATGRLGYALGLLALVPIPGLGAVLGGLAMALAYRRQRRTSPLAAENGRYAANWGLTVAAVSLLLIVTLSALGFAQLEWTTVFYVVMYTLLAVTATHLVVVVLGLWKASRREVLRLPIAVRFLRSGAPAMSEPVRTT